MPFIYIIISVGLIGIDQLVKFWVVSSLQLGQVNSVINGVISITRLNNDGAAWSMLTGQRWLFVVIALIAAAFIIYYLFKFNGHVVYQISLTLLLAGTLGNLIDRIIQGYVVDMFQLDFINFPIFNCADMFLTIGIIILAFKIIRD
ncbi:signal peptidase II [Lentilactobacillus kosonis]|uniref:Lipoprotein signal peptidase n=1 Tax=Lentilactobacillus kosonis TaxID=2810561 RepID=A0A401FKS7_9LACO|nr:signal peptidase II [Lentilactobacillus kosonis]GAY72989.1 lipoprotein signal peptidase [Lentilactobacillus kosonis]